MKYHRLSHIFLLGLTSLLLACGTTESFGLKTATIDLNSSWDLRLNPGPGAIDVTTTLEPGDRIRFKLTESGQETQIAYLQLLDADCDFGHIGHLVYRTERDGFQSLYLDQEIPWGEVIHMTFIWNPENNFLEAHINGQRQRVELAEVPLKLQVRGRSRTTTEVELLYYLPATSTSAVEQSL